MKISTLEELCQKHDQACRMLAEYCMSKHLYKGKRIRRYAKALKVSRSAVLMSVIRDYAEQKC